MCLFLKNRKKKEWSLVGEEVGESRRSWERETMIVTIWKKKFSNKQKNQKQNQHAPKLTRPKIYDKKHVLWRKSLRSLRPTPSLDASAPLLAIGIKRFPQRFI